MESNQQLAVIDLQQEFGIKVFGTIEEPYVKCSDLLIHVLGYKKSKDARWYREMDQIEVQMYIIREGGETPSFNEQGIYWALMKSNKPIAKQFQFRVTSLLKHMRIQRYQQLQQLQEEKKQLEQELDAIRDSPASIYKIYMGDQCIYVGQDKSKSQNRPQQHLTKRRALVQSDYQLIDRYLSTVDEDMFTIEIKPCLKSECDDLERDAIEELQPLYNITHNQDSRYQCQRCHKVYKSRKPYEKHTEICTQ